MLNKCANPDCSALLHRLRDGRLFVFDANAIQAKAPQSPAATRRRTPRYHWLCNDCLKTLTVSCKDGNVATVLRSDIVQGSHPGLSPLTKP